MTIWLKLPLGMVCRLLPHCNVVYFIMKAIERGISFNADSIIVILRITPAIIIYSSALGKLPK